MKIKPQILSTLMQSNSLI